MGLPVRKPNRLHGFDYSSQNAYFITICTEDRARLFWISRPKCPNCRPDDVPLSTYGLIVKGAIDDIPKYYPTVSVDHYVIMPDHIHLLLVISVFEKEHLKPPSIERVICQLKGIITKQIGSSVWQKSFHDHIIRNNSDYVEVWDYIDNNPLKWIMNPAKGNGSSPHDICTEDTLCPV